MTATSRSAAYLALTGLVSAFGFVLTYLVAVRTAIGQRADGYAFAALYALVPGGWLASLLSWFARPVEIVALAAVVLVLGVAAVARGAWWALVAALVTMTTLPATVWLRDDVLTRPNLVPDPFPENSLPSVHVTAAAALAAAALLLWPRPRPWWLAQTAGVLVLVSAVGNVLSQAHRPSDVLASVLLVAAVAGAAGAGLELVARSRGGTSDAEVPPP